jgi:cysteinyl-tRNA synthetase
MGVLPAGPFRPRPLDYAIIPPMIRFFNTLSGKVEPFVPLVPGEVKLYTCGPTVYDFAHIGNYRAYLFEDLLKRFLIFRGYRVRHVMNITDVDDKTIRGANEQGVPLRDYTAPFIEAFFQDLKILRVIPADVYPRATDHVPEMAGMICGLLNKGFAYRKDGSVYFDIGKFKAYGRLSKVERRELRSTKRIAARIEADEYEKDRVRDFALWKAPKEGEPVWETDIGPGRPGWHIECSAMSSKYLGSTFDIHCGGVDNIFPHHENEIAQSEAYYGAPFVRYWLHCHHLIVDGEKMSKSKGNFYLLRDLLERGADPLAIRFLLLATQYRKVLNFTLDALDQAKAALQRITDFVYELDYRTFPSGESPEFAGLATSADARFGEGFDDDLNVSASLTALFEFIKSGHLWIKDERLRADDANRARDLVYSWDGVLGVLPPRQERDLAVEIKERIEARERARAARDYPRADAIRRELLEAGIVLEDTKDGVRWKRIKTGGGS